MIKSIAIQDFQRHHEQVIHFEPVTTIVGPTDAGKSSIMRAIRWACLNKPDGSGFIKDGAEEAVVSIIIDQHEVVRSKGKDNTYLLDDELYKAFGRSNVPEDIEKAVNLSELNFQGQLDGPFWIALSPGEVAKQLNDIVDLSIIDESLSKIGKQARKAKDLVDFSRDRLEQVKEKEKSLEWVNEAKDEYTRLEEKEETLIKINGQRAYLANCLSAATSLKRSASTGQARATAGLAIVALAKQYATARTKRVKVQEVLNKVIQLSKTAQKEVPQTATLETTVHGYYKCKDSKGLLQKTLRRLKGAQETAEKAEKNHRVKRVVFEDAINGENCPICGGDLDQIDSL